MQRRLKELRHAKNLKHCLEMVRLCKDVLPTRDKRGMEPNGKRERRSECCHTLIIWRVYVKNEGEK